MTTRSELLALAERVEKAEGPSRELDAQIWCATLPTSGIGIDGYCLPDDDCRFVYQGHENSFVTVRVYREEVCTTQSYGRAQRPSPLFTRSLDVALTLLPQGFWWRGSTCYLSSEATVCPDHNNPQHRERLLMECPPTLSHWDEGVEVEIRPGSDNALVRALVSAALRARAAQTGDE